MRAATCERRGCTSAGTWQLGLVLRAEEPCDGEASVQLDRFVCSSCRRRLKPADVVTDDFWHDVTERVKQMQFCCEPSRARTRLNFTPLA